MAKLRGAGVIARPVRAGVIGAVGVGATVGLRTREDVVLVAALAPAPLMGSPFSENAVVRDRLLPRRAASTVSP